MPKNILPVTRELRFMREPSVEREGRRREFAMLAPFGTSVFKISTLVRLARLAFFAALIFTFVSAVIPPKQSLQIAPWDKAEQFIAFYVLAVLAAAAFPRRKLWVLAALLSGFGALIEFVQGLDIVGRDRDFWDWAADTIAIAGALAPMLLVRWRALAGASQKNIDM